MELVIASTAVTLLTTLAVFLYRSRKTVKALKKQIADIEYASHMSLEELTNLRLTARAGKKLSKLSGYASFEDFSKLPDDLLQCINLSIAEYSAKESTDISVHRLVKAKRDFLKGSLAEDEFQLIYTECLENLTYVNETPRALDGVASIVGTATSLNGLEAFGLVIKKLLEGRKEEISE